MAEQEEAIIQKNIGLSFDFARHEIGSEAPIVHPAFIRDVNVALLPVDDPELTGYNLQLAQDILEEGDSVIFVRAEKTPPNSAHYNAFTVQGKFTNL